MRSIGGRSGRCSVLLGALVLSSTVAVTTIAGPAEAADATPTLTQNQVTFVDHYDDVELFPVNGIEQISVFQGSGVTLGAPYQFVPTDPAQAGECLDPGPPYPATEVQCAMAGSGALAVVGTDTDNVMTFGCAGPSADPCPRTPTIQAGDGADELHVGGVYGDTGARRFVNANVDSGPGNDVIDLGEESSGVAAGGPGDDAITVTPASTSYAADEGPWVISCGDGDDTVVAGPNDTVSSDCEHVTGGTIVPLPNRAPKLHNDYYALVFGVARPLKVTRNDVDPDGDPLTMVSHSQGTYGKVTCHGVVCQYNGGSAFHHGDSFSYTVTDGHGHTVSARVFVRVQPRTSSVLRGRTGSGSGGPRTDLRVKRFTWGVGRNLCSFSQAGTDGDGVAYTWVWLRENGPSGVNRFDVQVRKQVQGRSWYGGDVKWITNDQREWWANTAYPDSYSSWTYTYRYQASWGPSAMTNGPWRLQVRGQWIHRRSAPLRDQVKYDSTWQTVCQGQPTGNIGVYG